MNNMLSKFNSMTVSPTSISKLQSIQNIIDKTIREDVIQQLSDTSLLPEYIKSKSVQARINNLKNTLQNNDITEEQSDKIIQDFALNLVPAGTKGVIRGYAFNKIVEKEINSYELLKSPRFAIHFEKRHPDIHTSEIPDFFIADKENQTLIVGMNQIDLWSGGAQTNRGSKYVIDDHRHSDPKIKFINVICNRPVIKSEKNKCFQIFDIGLHQERMCYLGNLKNIIYNFFNLV